MIAATLRSDRGGSSEDDLGIRFNNDTASNYDGYSVRHKGTGPTVDALEALAASSAKFSNFLTAATATANKFSGVKVIVPHYVGSTDHKELFAEGGKLISTSTGGIHSLRGVGEWRNGNAVNRVTVIPAGGGSNFKSGSRLSLYTF